VLKRTPGIVLGSLKYKETSIIVKIFTREFGTQSFIVNGVRSSKARGKAALYQPLSLLDLVIYYKEGKGLHRISEAKLSAIFQDIPFHPVKRTIGIFLTEFFSKILREEEANSDLFEFLFHAIEYLDHQHRGIENFHLQLLLKSAVHLGFGPQGDLDFIQQLMEAGMHFTPLENEEKYIEQLIKSPFGSELKINSRYRREILDQIVKFYAIHLHERLEIKSIEVLKTVLKA
jgi:DNA repair protein RecO (recombination protein O)